MTREDAKNWLNKLYTRTDITDEYGDMEDMQPYEEAVNMAIKALEQQPCEDTVSRQTVLDEVNRKFNEINIILENLPSVQSSRKGHWIERDMPIRVDSKDANLRWLYECSECDYEVRQAYNYCPNCGAEMKRGKNV